MHAAPFDSCTAGHGGRQLSALICWEAIAGAQAEHWRAKLTQLTLSIGLSTNLECCMM